MDSLAHEDEKLVAETQRIERQRQEAAEELHGICAAFVKNVNGMLTAAAVELDPENFKRDDFHDDKPNLFQINVRGRIVQIEFEAPQHLTSTEHFRIPYILEGAIRGFNQELLESQAIEEQSAYYVIERQKAEWRYFDPRTYRTGPFDEDYLVSLMERLV